MTFVTEKISPQDIEKYDLLTVNKSIHKGSIGNWTIDRERGIYLRNIYNYGGEYVASEFSFYWKGHLLRIMLETLSYEGEQDGPLRQTLKLVTFPEGIPLWLPPELEDQRAQIISDFKEAVIAYKTFQCGRQYTSFMAIFTF